MRLLNSIAQAHEKRFLYGIHRIPDAVHIREHLEECPTRFALESDVTAMSRRLVTQQPDLLCKSLDLLRLPDPITWIEWTEDAANPQCEASEAGEEPGFQVGLLVSSDPSGQSGDITVVFSNENGEPEVPPVSFTYDFGALYPLSRNDLSFSMNHDTLELSQLFERVHGQIDPAWAAHWRKEGGEARFRIEKERLAQSLWMVPAMLFSFCLILGASGQVRRHDVDYAKLNRKRVKHGKPALLAHSELRLELFGVPDRAPEAANDAYGRQGPRLHHVRGHFVRRGNAIFWRKPHLRGDTESAMTTFRTKRVSMG